MNNDHLTSQQFSIIKRAHSVAHAWRGVGLFLKSTHNAWVHIAVAIVVVALGFLFEISHAEWLMIVLAIGLVLSAEAFNTAIEIDMNLTSPEYHPYARDTKDVAAGAVLIAALAALVIGLCVFAPHILALI